MTEPTPTVDHAVRAVSARGLDEPTRRALTAGLAALVARTAADLREQMRSDPDVRARAQKLHADEQAGTASGDFDVWTDLLSRRAAVMWVLKSVYVRVLEDRGLLTPRRLVDTTSPQLFARLAPDLGDTAYLRWIYRDLAQPDGGLPELFALQPAELAFPSDATSRALLDFWRERDADTGALRWTFHSVGWAAGSTAAGEFFDGRLLGDLYQDLDPVVKERFALLQTPDFVLDFILDQTLTPAIAEFGIDHVRVLDPACGSGHFLLEAFRRLVAGLREAHPERPLAEIVPDVLSRVVGIDLNDYACGLARARLVMTALETLGSSQLADASRLHPEVYWADGLEQLEHDDRWQQRGLAFEGATEEAPRASLTPIEIRERLRPHLEKGFHAVVGNPPYIVERDAAKKAYHREKVGKKQRYTSAYREYSLGAPFTERLFQLAIEGGFVGQITANSFMKREFGKALIEEVLPRYALTKVVDTSGAYIPGHGTPTVLLFGRRLRSTNAEIPVVMGKRGEPGKPDDPATGRVWTSIREGHATPGFENEFVSVSLVEREKLQKHPWSIGGGGAAELKEAIDAGRESLGKVGDVGFSVITGEDNVLTLPTVVWPRLRLPAHETRVLVAGDEVRDWSVSGSESAVWSLTETGEPIPPSTALLDALWIWRSCLRDRKAFGKPIEERGLSWWMLREVYQQRLRTPLTITFGEVATHNHFALDRGGKVFNRTAPVIKLPAGASEEEHLALLAQLNSSLACFWLKQVMMNKGAGGVGGGYHRQPWSRRYQFDGTKLKSFPLATTRDANLEAFASKLDTLARARLDASVGAAIAAHATAGAAALRTALDDRRKEDLARLRRMVALQEELDWTIYRAYGLDEGADLRPASADLGELEPGERPFELVLARRNRDVESAPEPDGEGDDGGEYVDEWFERHGWTPRTDLTEVNDAWRDVVAARLKRTEESRDLGLLEQPTHKRRWYRPDYDKDEKEALALWLADRVEREAEKRTEAFTVRQLAAALQNDPAVEAVATLLAGKAFDLDRLVAKVLETESVPNFKHHVYKEKGLVKRAAWERTWELQHAEDAWDQKKKAHEEALAAGTPPEAAPPLPEGKRPTPEVPPKYTSGDFLKPTYWKHRGKLDVPKERFVALTELPKALTDEARTPRYAWAGLTPLQRAKLLLALDEEAEEAGVPLQERYPLLYGVQFLLPYVRWRDQAAQSAAKEFQTVIRHLVGEDGVTEEMIANLQRKAK
ncbi:MAG: BREX-2 system adenine-specific DNA-methyltransferase PglX [Myxococcota bacterium]|nr:BREX-2 system adenine-specific DNA-methyltransferase PglX [Myxococcota bacterium]